MYGGPKNIWTPYVNFQMYWKTMSDQVTFILKKIAQTHTKHCPQNSILLNNIKKKMLFKIRKVKKKVFGHSVECFNISFAIIFFCKSSWQSLGLESTC